MNSIREVWVDAMSDSSARWIVAIFGLVTGILIAVYVVKWFRDLAFGRGQDPVSHLSEFERLHAEGKLNKEEYQRLKKTIPHNLLPAIKADRDALSSSRKKTTSGNSSYNPLLTPSDTNNHSIASSAAAKQLSDADEAPDFMESQESD